MANLISKIKAPNNTEYLLKDSTLAADTGISIADIDSNNQRKIKNIGVTGVKGNSESAYRTGQVNLTAANIGAKATQSAVNDVAADGTSVTFISQVTQNTQGVISPVKKTVATMGAASADAAGSAGLVPAPAAGKQGQYLRGDGTWATPSNTTYTFDGTYNSSTNKAATVSTVTNAINALDVEESTGTTLQTITAISETNGKIAATYSDIASASTSGKGVVQLSSATNSTSTSLAATASAVKAAYDLAASKTANTGTVTKVTPGNGLINGTSGTSQTAITGTGTISIKEGGVTNAMLAGSIENGKLSHSKVTIAGNEVSLGGSVTADTLRESLGLSNAMHFVGTTTTTMSDGLTTKNVTINSKTYTPNSGDVVLYSDAEFVWTGSAWERLGRDSSFKTTQSAVTDPSADGTSTAFIDSITQNANGVISPHKASLPTASTSTTGIMKVGTGLSASSGTVSVSYGTAANTACQGNDSRLSNARTPTSHTHGNLTNDGKITTTATIANGDKLVIVDSDTTAASKITGSSIAFDGSTTTKALTPKGTWETFVKSQYTLPAATTSALGGIKLSSASDATPTGSLTVPIGTLASDGLTYAYTPVAGTDLMGNNTPLGMIHPDKGFVQETTVVSGVELPRHGVWSVATMGGATSSADGTFGAPPSPKKGDQAKFLRGDATWQSVITAHRTYTAFTGKPAANATPGFGESFTISQIAQSTTGQVSGTDRTVTIPALPTASTSVAGIVKFGTAAGTAAQGNHNHDSTYVNVSGDTMTGDLTFKKASTADSPDIVWQYGDTGNEQARLWMGSGGTAKWAPLYRCYKSDGTSLYNGSLVLGDGTGASGSWGISVTGSSNSVRDSNNTTVTTFAYSKTGLNYADYTWLAAWNGYELRAVNKSQFAQASHNHDGTYVNVSGDTMTGALNLANNIWNQVGDDAYIGDINKGGHIGIQGKNGNTGLFFTTYNQTSKTTGAALTWDGSHLTSDKPMKTPNIVIDQHVTLQYNSTDASLDFVFA